MSDAGWHPARNVTDEELIAAIQAGCEETGKPVVTTTTVAQHDAITIKQDGVRKRLNKLAESGEIGKISTGSGTVWWVPEDGQGGEVDPRILDGSLPQWEEIDPDMVPPEFLERCLPNHDGLSADDLEEFEELLQTHPEYKPASRWERYTDRAQTLAQTALPLFVASIAVIILEDSAIGATLPFVPTVSLPALLVDLAALTLLSTVGMVVFAAVYQVASILGPRVSRIMTSKST